MTKNITFSTNEALINERREAAKANHTLLNEQFRSRLAQYVRRWRSQRALEAIRRDQPLVSASGSGRSGLQPGRDELAALTSSIRMS